jgi:hypothetical protein
LEAGGAVITCIIGKPLTTRNKINHMSKIQVDHRPDKASKTGEVRMGREVSSKAPTAGDLNTKAKSPAAKAKQEVRENAASSLV